MTPESRPTDCPHCGVAVDPTANFCPQCGTAVGDSSRAAFCPDCGESFDHDDEFCSHCGHARTDDRSQSASSQSTERTETREAFRRRVTDHLEAGWELKEDGGDHVTLVDRDIGSIPLHVLLLFTTSGVGNLLYGWYHYAKRAERRYLSVGDGRQPRPPGPGSASDNTTTGSDTTNAVLSYLAGGLVGFLAIWFLFIGIVGTPAPVVGVLGVLFALGGLSILPPVRQRLDRRHPVTKFGRRKSVDHRVVHPTEGYDDPCVVCGRQGRSGLRRRRRDETVVAGVPLLTHKLDHNYYCEQCATTDLFGGANRSKTTDEETETVSAVEPN